MEKISFQAAMNFITDYENGVFGSERLGQAFVNEFHHDVVPNDRLTDLFFMTDFFEAKATILGEYVEFDQ